MTQFPDQIYYDPTMPPDTMVGGRRRSGLAITALVFSLIGVIPCCGGITAPVGVLLGAIGLVAIPRHRTGKGMCLAAIILGVLFAAAQYGLGYVGFKRFLLPVFQGPHAALDQGFAGNMAGFKAEFTGAAARAPDEAAQEFIDELRKRYGEFQSVEMDQTSRGGPSANSQNPEQTFPYFITFSNAPKVQAEATMVFADANGFLMKWREITVFDAALGDLTYPPPEAASTGGLPSPSQQPQPSTTGPDAPPNGDGGDGDGDTGSDSGGTGGG